MTDMTGRVFGKLTVTVPTEKRNKRGSVVWRCECECGNVTEVSLPNLLNGSTVSCGCRWEETKKTVYRRLHRMDGTCIESLMRSGVPRRDNKTGFAGVSLYNGRYRANINFKGRRYYLGAFDTVLEAAAVRAQAEKELHEPFLKEYYSK